jgi:chromate transporter
MSLWLFFEVVLKATLLSTGGLGPLPSLHADFMALNWAGERQFTEALTIGQITPGPTGLWVISLGYIVAGLPGAILACGALLVPPFFVLVVQRGHARIADHPATQGFLDGVVLVIASFSIIILAGILQSNGLDIKILVLVVISAILAISRKVSANFILLGAAVIGLLWG